MSNREVYKRCGCRAPDGRRLGISCPRLADRGHGSWYFALELPRGHDGRRNRLRRGGYRSRQAAQAARAYLLGGDLDTGRRLVTLGQWLDIWLDMRTLSVSTRRLYTQHIRDYLRPHLGNVPLPELTTGRIQAMFASLQRTSALRGRPLSPATLQRIRACLRTALNGAIRHGLLERNPARWVELPSGQRPRAVVWTPARVAQWQATGQRPPVAVWTPGQTAAFLRHAHGHRLYPLYLLVALLGLRRGEAAGLRWCDLDLGARVLEVSHQVQEHNGRTVICPPKTDHSIRTLALDHVTAAELRRLHAACHRAGQGEPTGFLFAHPDGRPLSPGYLTHTFRRLTAQAGLPPIRLHDLRHGAASLSLAAGNDLKAVQDMLGHASIVLTADTYTTVLPSLARQAAENTLRLVLQAARQDAHAIRQRSHQAARRHRGPARRSPGTHRPRC
ncbi:tyrosine-type recombinase/integrase [Amycolatopsis alkalitolerans]|uniref:Site-specific integrase n=1 Tax=Amycolatopsis alkalitolerans TaxID=2547244 RepID=A0A5C4M6F4_9PSEU|nr:site-specific integrase [Amycolatopsis alkalitolerans]TNC28020.1 site-specific integrase [Amycolatopsis alkalitolerans]